MIDQIKSLAREYAPDCIAIRRHLHANPELSYQEFETSKFVQSKLTEYGIPFQVLADTGVVGLIEGLDPKSRIVALRADMDALPIQEENEIPYKSTNPGVMHACGHDVHTTCLLGAAHILQQTRQLWSGTVKLIFQPGEEKNPGGASLMIRDGVLENPAPSAIFGLHVHPGLPIGQVSFRPGKVMASADELYFTIKGKGGHAASPHLCIDPILIASQLIIALQQLVSRHNNPFNPTVLSITAFNAGTTTNIIPDDVKLKGTFRAMDEEWRFKAHQIIRQTATGIVEGMGGILDLHIDIGYPSVYNNEQLYETARALAGKYLGTEHVEETEMRMGAEDFGYYSQKIAGCFFRLGVMNKTKGITHGVHTPRFNIDENAIEIGMGLMAWLGATAVR
ncbi:MAG: M20 family metallopeptidase [Chitinophagaceae bacterium]